MKKIASHSEIDIFAPDSSRFSFLKSPYAAHKSFSAVDIYYGRFGSEAVSPVDGIIHDIQHFESPTPFKDRDFAEYVIAIRQNKSIIKILHVKPDVRIGDSISSGNRIGTFIRNGYFIFWNDPPMHVEVRRPDDYLRASNNLCLTPNIKWSEFSSCKTLRLDCQVEYIDDRYALLLAPYETYGEVKGFPLAGGLLDGFVGADHEDSFFGVIRPQDYFIPAMSSLEVTKNGSMIKCAGVATCLHFNEPRIKVVPTGYGIRPFSTGDKVRIRIEIR